MHLNLPDIVAKKNLKKQMLDYENYCRSIVVEQCNDVCLSLFRRFC